MDRMIHSCGSGDPDGGWVVAQAVGRPPGQPVAEGQAHGLGAALDAQLGEDVVNMIAGGGGADASLSAMARFEAPHRSP